VEVPERIVEPSDSAGCAEDHESEGALWKRKEKNRKAPQEEGHDRVLVLFSFGDDHVSLR